MSFYGLAGVDPRYKDIKTVLQLAGDIAVFLRNDSIASTPLFCQWTIDGAASL